MARTELVFSLREGIDRRGPALSDQPGPFADMVGLIPDASGNMRTVGAETSEAIAPPIDLSTLSQVETVYHPGNWRKMAYVSCPSGLYAFENFSPAIQSAETGVGRPGLSAIGNKIAFANPPNKLAIYNMDTGGTLEVDDAPKGDAVAAWLGALWIGNVNEDVSMGAVSVPMLSIGVPFAPSSGKSGSGDVSNFKLTDSSGQDGVFTGAAGQIVFIGGDPYKVKAVSTVNHIDDTVEVYPVDNQPDDGTGYAWELVGDSIVEACPASVDLGQVFQFSKSSTMAVAIKNKSATASIKIVSVTPSGAELRLENQVSGVTIPPGGIYSIMVSATPQALGTRNLALTVNLNNEAQDSLTIPVTVIGTRKKVLADQSAVYFGALTPDSESERTLSIVNDSGMDAILTGWSISQGFSLVDPVSFPTEPVLLKPEESYKIKIKAVQGSPGAQTGALSFSRAIAKNPGRIWYSSPDDITKWDLDTDWIDLTAYGPCRGITALQPFDNGLWVFTADKSYEIQPGGVGKFRVVEHVGSMFGCKHKINICVGGGKLWWAGPTGIYCAGHDGIERVSDKVFDVYAASAYGEEPIPLAFYKDMLVAFLSCDLDNAPADAPRDSVWCYSQRTGGWYRLDGALDKYISAQFITRKIYAFGVQESSGGNQELMAVSNMVRGQWPQWYFSRLDNDFSASNSFGFISKHLAMQGFCYRKNVLSGQAFMSDGDCLSAVAAIGTEGQVSFARIVSPALSPELVTYGSGFIVATNPNGGEYNAEQILGKGFPDWLVSFGCDVVVNGASYQIGGAIGEGRISVPSLTMTGRIQATIRGPARTRLLAQPFWFPAPAGGTAIQFVVVGSVSQYHASRMEPASFDALAVQYDIGGGIGARSEFAAGGGK